MWGHRETGKRELARVRLKPSRLTIIAAAFGACVLQACASAPLNLGPQPETPPLIAAQETLHTAASTLTVTARQEGWRLDDDRQAGAFALLGRLVTGAASEGAETGETGEPVELYLMRHGDAPGAALLGDISLAGALAHDVIQAGRAVAGSEAELSEDAINRDIAEIEAALTAARRARSFFAAVEAELGARDTLRQEMQVRTALMRLDERIETLAVTADALAARRWGSGRGALS